MTTTHHTNDIAAAMGATIKQAISAAGITQHEAARRTGIPLRTLSRRLNGSPLYLDELIGLARATDTTATQLMAQAEGGEPLPPRPPVLDGATIEAATRHLVIDGPSIDAAIRRHVRADLRAQP